MQGSMQQMRCGVITHNIVATSHIHFGDAFVADFRLPRNHFADMNDHTGCGAAHVGDFDFPTQPLVLSPHHLSISLWLMGWGDASNIASIAHLPPGSNV